MPDVICIGDILMDMVPDREGAAWEKIQGFQPVPGGSVANVSAGLAKQAVDTAFIGQVGEDPFGEMLVSSLKKSGVDVSQVKSDPGIRTTLAFVSIPEKGKNEFVFYRNPGADMMLSPGDINEEFIKQSKLLHFGSISITAEPCYSAVQHAVELAHSHGLLVSFDPNFRPRLWASREEARARIIECLQMVDIVKMNEEELEFITGTKELPRGAAMLLKRGPRVAMITQGERGSFFCNVTGHCSLCGWQVEVADTVGCGDAFMAGALRQILPLIKKGADPSRIGEGRAKGVLEFANAAAALTARGKGAIDSLPTGKQVEAFMSDYRSG